MTRAAIAPQMGDISVNAFSHQSRKLDLRTAVHHHREAAGPRLGGSSLVDDAKLHPHDAGFKRVLNRDRLPHDLQRRLGGPENVDDVGGRRNCGKV